MTRRAVMVDGEALRPLCCPNQEAWDRAGMAAACREYGNPCAYLRGAPRVTGSAVLVECGAEGDVKG